MEGEEKLFSLVKYYTVLYSIINTIYSINITIF